MSTKIQKITPLLVIFIVILVNLIFGLPRIKNYSAVDEHLWTYDRTPDFWNAISEKRWKNTRVNDKPGLTVAYISGIGLLAKNPLDYDNLRKGEDIKSKDELSLVQDINLYFRLPIYLLILMMLPVFYIFLKKLFNQEIALFSIIFIYLSPVLLGMSLFVNPDSLLWVFVSLSIISFLLFQKNKSNFYIAYAGLFLGLALLTKYTAVILFIFFLFLIFLRYFFQESRELKIDYFKKSLIGYFILCIVSHLVVFLLFPAIWKNIEILWSTIFQSRPFRPIWQLFSGFLILFTFETFFLKNIITRFILDHLMKYRKVLIILTFLVFILGFVLVIINVGARMNFYDFSYALLTPKPGENTSIKLISLAQNIATAFYVIIFSIIPIALLSFLFFIFSSTLTIRKNAHKSYFLAAFSILFFILIYYIGNALNFIESTVRYQISVYPLIAILSGIGFFQISETKILSKFSKNYFYLLLIIFSFVSLFLSKPFFFSYTSDILPKKYIVNPKGMGDGSFEAATYLNNLPNSEKLRIWTDKVAVCEYFIGKCYASLKDKNLAGVEIDYLVISQGNINKSLGFINLRGISNPAFSYSLFEKYYNTDTYNTYKIEVDNRPNNFVKIIKNNIVKNDKSIPFLMPEILLPNFSDNNCDIRNYGAQEVEDFLNTEAFKKAISDCSKKGGGKVIVPPGKWLTGPIHLVSNINLEVQEGAILNFTTDLDAYLPPVFTRFEGIEFYGFSPFIYAKNSENIAITGKGEINGQGDAWEEIIKIPKNKEDALLLGLPSNTIAYNMAQDGVPVEKRVFDDKKNPIQPSFIQFVNCKKILIEDIDVINGPNWTIHPIYSEDILIKGVTVKTNQKNTDGIVIDSSKNIEITNSILETGDDAIVIKSGKDKDGWRINKPSENIIIHDIRVNGGHGAIAIGSEMSGDVRNVYAYNISVGYVDFGIRLKSMLGRGGVVEKIWINNIQISRAVQSAIQIDLNYGTPPINYDKNKPPIFRDIVIEDLICRRTKNAATLIGLPESPLDKITLRNINIKATKDIYKENITNETFEKLNIEIL